MFFKLFLVSFKTLIIRFQTSRKHPAMALACIGNAHGSKGISQDCDILYPKYYTNIYARLQAVLKYVSPAKKRGFVYDYIIAKIQCLAQPDIYQCPAQG